VLTQYTDSAGHRARFPVTPQGHVFSDWGVYCSNPPASATDRQLAAVAVAYASYLNAHGTTIGRNDQIIVISPSGTNPGGGFGSQYCAYHNWAAYGSGDISWTNLPYMPDQGGNCGANIIQGPFDGWSIVGGHEFTESANDPLVNLHSAWYDAAKFEIGDKCAWIGIFIQGLPSGHFAEQPEWSNEDNSCQRSDIVYVAFPGNKSTKKGTAVSLQVHASAPDPVVFSATGLPKGLSISSSGKITGKVTAAIGHYKVTVYGHEPATSVNGHTNFMWTVTS
jgi:serine protease